MKLLDIGDVAKRTGIAPSTLRYYDDEGLIDSLARHGLRRQFDPNVILQLTLISMGKTAGFSLKEIKQMLTPDGAPKIDKSEIVAKASQLDKQIAQLSALRDTLNHVATCPAPSHMECKSFRRLVSVASKRLATHKTR
ncbi:helix-turn-helix domain-containing protein [Maritalea porphyrae]|uniref:helix-turn-helix domain-containing protein n=1 Tax=Maritalea porphyrae TaxID=880732 RepID=UPI0022AF2DB5|nr:helix-turn-helix domain-containing protein [Maritalea porphyrae]MCZ4272993.1 helix-turn-helix domain-containing protein [Maritalea porphyrae]